MPPTSYAVEVTEDLRRLLPAGWDRSAEYITVHGPHGSGYYDVELASSANFVKEEFPDKPRPSRMQLRSFLARAVKANEAYDDEFATEIAFCQDLSKWLETSKPSLLMRRANR